MLDEVGALFGASFSKYATPEREAARAAREEREFIDGYLAYCEEHGLDTATFSTWEYEQAIEHEA